MTASSKSKLHKRRRKKMICVSLIFIISFALLTVIIGSKFSKNKAVAASSLTSSSSATASSKPSNDNLNTKDAETRELDMPSNSANEHNELSDFNPYKPDGEKVAYLTFDDGPSPTVTPKILDELSKYNVKATFFLIGKMASYNSNLVKREKSEGHFIANHTYSHDYKSLYSNPDNFINDLNKCDNTLKGILGNYDGKLIRFPGGSFGKKLAVYRQAAVKAGYHYVDWNALNGDAEANNLSKDKLFATLKQTVAGKQHVVVLMHDAPNKNTTAQALPEIIEYLEGQGYTFKTLQ